MKNSTFKEIVKAIKNNDIDSFKYLHSLYLNEFTYDHPFIHKLIAFIALNTNDFKTYLDVFLEKAEPSIFHDLQKWLAVKTDLISILLENNKDHVLDYLVNEKNFETKLFENRQAYQNQSLYNGDYDNLHKIISRGYEISIYSHYLTENIHSHNIENKIKTFELVLKYSGYKNQDAQLYLISLLLFKAQITDVNVLEKIITHFNIDFNNTEITYYINSSPPDLKFYYSDIDKMNLLKKHGFPWESLFFSKDQSTHMLFSNMIKMIESGKGEGLCDYFIMNGLSASNIYNHTYYKVLLWIKDTQDLNNINTYKYMQFMEFDINNLYNDIKNVSKKCHFNSITEEKLNSLVSHVEQITLKNMIQNTNQHYKKRL